MTVWRHYKTCFNAYICVLVQAVPRQLWVTCVHLIAPNNTQSVHLRRDSMSLSNHQCNKDPGRRALLLMAAEPQPHKSKNSL